VDDLHCERSLCGGVRTGLCVARIARGERALSLDHGSPGGRADFRDSGQRLKYTERHGLAIGDFDGDHDPDVFSAGYEEQHLWLNQGDGQLQAHN